MIVRSDCGSESVLVAAMQSYFRPDGDDEFAGSKAHQYGSSPSNQRVEGWWSIFRQSRSDWAGAVDCLVPVSKAKIQQVEPQCEMEVEENIYKEYFEYIMETKGWGYSLNEGEGFNLFQSLKQLQG